MENIKILHKTKNELNECEKNQIIEYYYDIFSMPPRNEVINKKKIYYEFFLLNNTAKFSLLYFKDNLVGYIFTENIEFFTDKHLINNYHKNDLYLNTFLILQNMQNKGLGKKLLYNHIYYLQNIETNNNLYTRCRNDIDNIIYLLSNKFIKILQYETSINNSQSIKTIFKLNLNEAKIDI